MIVPKPTKPEIIYIGLLCAVAIYIVVQFSIGYVNCDGVYVRTLFGMECLNVVNE